MSTWRLLTQLDDHEIDKCVEAYLMALLVGEPTNDRIATEILAEYYRRRGADVCQ